MQQIKLRPDAALLQTMLLRSMQQAVYSPDNIGHFGLAYEAYAHFTSPIRRYPDLLTHRAIKAILQGKKYEPKLSDKTVLNTNVSNATRKQQAKDKAEGKPKKTDLTIWDALGVHCSANERRADEASRDVEAWLKCYFMQDKLGEEFTGTITGVTTFGVFVQLDTLFVEGLVHVTELGTDYFQYDDARHELRGERTGKRYQLTDRLTVQVARVDLETRKIDLRLVTEGEVAGEEVPDKPAAAASATRNPWSSLVPRPSSAMKSRPAAPMHAMAAMARPSRNAANRRQHQQHSMRGTCRGGATRSKNWFKNKKEESDKQ